jgi:hypothetical protein
MRPTLEVNPITKQFIPDALAPATVMPESTHIFGETESIHGIGRNIIERFSSRVEKFATSMERTSNLVRRNARKIGASATSAVALLSPIIGGNVAKGATVQDVELTPNHLISEPYKFQQEPAPTPTPSGPDQDYQAEVSLKDCIEAAKMPPIRSKTKARLSKSHKKIDISVGIGSIPENCEQKIVRKVSTNVTAKYITSGKYPQTIWPSLSKGLSKVVTDNKEVVLSVKGQKVFLKDLCAKKRTTKQYVNIGIYNVADTNFTTNLAVIARDLRGIPIKGKGSCKS